MGTGHPERTQTYGYDHNGNLTSDGSRTFGYHVTNRLTSVSGTASMTLTYDLLGRLRQTVSGGSTTQFLYEDRLIAEYDGNSNLVRRYVHGAGVDNPIVWYEGPDLTDRRWLYTDERGSVIAHTTTSGSVGAYSYGPHGERTTWAGSRFSYTGQQDLGRPIDFGRQSDREAIGKALIKYLQGSGACTKKPGQGFRRAK